GLAQAGDQGEGEGGDGGEFLHESSSSLSAAIDDQGLAMWGGHSGWECRHVGAGVSRGEGSLAGAKGREKRMNRSILFPDEIRGMKTRIQGNKKTIA
ncbi:hypothetical protein, partial [Pseudomonas aeruginosa]|uniref:hypothetical protein n=1 Tax=Pseudomonas aeruginosa TaxID=287 RepID=UPI001ABCBB2F